MYSNGVESLRHLLKSVPNVGGGRFCMDATGITLSTNLISSFTVASPCRSSPARAPPLARSCQRWHFESNAAEPCPCLGAVPVRAGV